MVTISLSEILMKFPYKTEGGSPEGNVCFFYALHSSNISEQGHEKTLSFISNNSGKNTIM